MEFSQKITAAHLKRRAVLYIRQSTMKQVYENAESTIRQYALKDRLVTLGWSEECITVIDSDLGHSGADAGARDGFKQLVADVGSGEAGAVACIECSRLSRNSHDWGRLMEICAITKTVLIDADGVYDPNDFNDRMLLGLKGTISEAELHFIRARMNGGKISKVKRGELRIPLATGYIYVDGERIEKDPNAEVRGAIELLFDTFRRIGSANGTAAFFNRNGYMCPNDTGGGFCKGEIQWKPLTEHRTRAILHNPLYAGIYSYGKQRWEHTLDGKKIRNVAEDDWLVRLEDHHEGYISIEEYYGNVAKLKANNSRNSGSAPREGTALLQGIAICGKCGSKMAVQYYVNKDGQRTPYYVCGANNWANHGKRCQSVQGTVLDNAVSNLILETLTPMAVEEALEVEREASRRKEASENYFQMQVERSRYEMELAKKRYMSVDPSNRLVAFELERLWNTKIVEMSQSEEDLNRHIREKNAAKLNGSVSAGLDGLSGDLNEIWHSGQMRIQDKKRVLRCLLEDVTITKGYEETMLGVLFKTGAARAIECKNAKPSYTGWTTSFEVLNYIREKSPSHTAEEISNMLNHEGHKTGMGGEFTTKKVTYLMRYYNIPTMESCFREKGYRYSDETAASLGVSLGQLGKLRQKGKLNLEWVIVDAKPIYMYSPA